MNPDVKASMDRNELHARQQTVLPILRKLAISRIALEEAGARQPMYGCGPVPHYWQPDWGMWARPDLKASPLLWPL